MSHPLSSDLDFVLDHTRDLWDELRGGRIFITGATGFFGCWLLETFSWANQRLELGARATILSRNPVKLSQVLPHLAGDASIEVAVGDVRNFSFSGRAFTHVIHAATESSAKLNRDHPDVMFDTIVEGTRRCLDFAATCGAQKFLFPSSGAVYGKQSADLARVPEDFGGGPDPLNPYSAYAEGKRAAESLCALAARKTGLEVKIARCFTFVGPYMKLDAHFAIGNFIRDRLNGNSICVQGDGTAVRSYMYASDLMVWLWTILFRGEPSRPYNVGSDEAISIAELAREVASSGSAPVPVEVLGKPAAGAAAARYVPDTTRAQRELGLSNEIPLRAAIEKTVQWNTTQHHAEWPEPAIEVGR